MKIGICGKMCSGKTTIANLIKEYDNRYEIFSFGMKVKVIANELFGMDYDRIHVVIHPKSIVHSAIETIDGAIIAHIGRPDMRYPIQYAMTYPDRLKTPWKQASLTELSGLEFFEPDFQKFPLLKHAYDAGRLGGAAPVVLNAANEVAVAMFLKDQIRFIEISEMVSEIMTHFSTETVSTLDDIIALDRRVKDESHSIALRS